MDNTNIYVCLGITVVITIIYVSVYTYFTRRKNLSTISEEQAKYTRYIHYSSLVYIVLVIILFFSISLMAYINYKMRGIEYEYPPTPTSFPTSPFWQNNGRYDSEAWRSPRSSRRSF
jgi:hypothetical protein